MGNFHVKLIDVCLAEKHAFSTVRGVNYDHIFDRGKVTFASKAQNKAFLSFTPLWFFVNKLDNFPKSRVLSHTIQFLQINTLVLFGTFKLVVAILLILYIHFQFSITRRAFYLWFVTNCSR